MLLISYKFGQICCMNYDSNIIECNASYFMWNVMQLLYEMILYHLSLSDFKKNIQAINRNLK